MKRGTIEHPKMKRFAKAMDIPICTAVGILECLWHFTAKYARQGDIGRYSDEDIAEAVYWKDDPRKLIRALVQCGWIDEDPTCRLVIHDWFDHAEDALHNLLSRRGERFSTGQVPKMNRLSKKERKTLEKQYDGEACARHAHEKRKAKAIAIALSHSHSPKTNMSSSKDDMFNIGLNKIWNLWPSKRRTTHKRVEGAYRSALKKIPHEQLVHIIREYVESPKIQSLLSPETLQYIPLLPTWLNQEGWTEDREAWQCPHRKNGDHSSSQPEPTPEQKKNGRIEYHRKLLDGQIKGKNIKNREQAESLLRRCGLNDEEMAAVLDGITLGE